MSIDYKAYIQRDPAICGGEPVIAGTRVTVRTVLASLAEGAEVDSILFDFPSLSRDAVRAVIAFAAASAEEDLPAPPLPDENIPRRLVDALGRRRERDRSGARTLAALLCRPDWQEDSHSPTLMAQR